MRNEQSCTALSGPGAVEAACEWATSATNRWHAPISACMRPRLGNQQCTGRVRGPQHQPADASEQARQKSPWGRTS